MLILSGLCNYSDLIVNVETSDLSTYNNNNNNNNNNKLRTMCIVLLASCSYDYILLNFISHSLIIKSTSMLSLPYYTL
jgi:hypothetical protein